MSGSVVQSALLMHSQREIICQFQVVGFFYPSTLSDAGMPVDRSGM